MEDALATVRLENIDIRGVPASLRSGGVRSASRTSERDVRRVAEGVITEH